MKFTSLIPDLSRVHIYENHNEAVNEQLSKDVNAFEMPTLKFSENFYKSLQKLRENPFTQENLNVFLHSLIPEDFELSNYKSFPAIKAEMLAPKTIENECINNPIDNNSSISTIGTLNPTKNS